MKKLIGIFIVATLALTSCNNQQPKTEAADIKQVQVDPKQEFAKLNEFLRKFDEPSQTFKAPTNKLIKVKGKQGTIIYINPSDLETESGQPIGKDVEIELKELSSQQQLLRANAQTVSDGQLLVSGGACFINVTSDGQKVKLKDGKTYSVALPKLSDDEMTLYYGQRDSSDKMNWKQADQKFEVTKPKGDSIKSYEAIIVSGLRRKDTSRVAMKDMSKEEVQQEIEKNERENKVSNKVYQPVAINQFGWINCDRLFQQDAPRTNIQFAIVNKAEEVNYVNVYLIFSDIKSLMQSSYYVEDNKIEKNDFDNIPVGTSVKFLAVCYQHEKIFAVLTDNTKVTSNQNEKLLLKEMSETEFDKLMKSVQ